MVKPLMDFQSRIELRTMGHTGQETQMKYNIRRAGVL